jgi:hypothetical protein
MKITCIIALIFYSLAVKSENITNINEIIGTVGNVNTCESAPCIGPYTLDIFFTDTKKADCPSLYQTKEEIAHLQTAIDEMKSLYKERTYKPVAIKINCGVIKGIAVAGKSNGIACYAYSTEDYFGFWWPLWLK